MLKEERPGLLLGAGILLSVADLVRAKENGAQFGVAPGFNPEIVKKVREVDLPFFPGVMTPTEIERGLSMGTKWMKFFPSEASGGIKMLKAVSAPSPIWTSDLSLPDVHGRSFEYLSCPG